MEAMLEGLVFDGTGRPFPKYTLGSDGLTGLFGGSGVRRESVSRPNQHGDFSLPGYRGARSFRLQGLVHSDSGFGQIQDLSAISSILGDGGSGVLSMQTEAGGRSVVVELADDPQVEILVYGSVARYMISLRAPDPRLYGVQRQFSGSTVMVHHYGNFPASPVVEVSGPRSAPYTISGPGGRKVTVDQVLTAGQTHRIDFLKGRVYQNSTLQFGVLSEANFWTLPPGKRTSMSISSGSMTVHVDDTYM